MNSNSSIFKYIVSGLLGCGLFCLSILPGKADYRPTPVGIIDLQSGTESITDLDNDPGWTNPNVNGFMIRQSWSRFEPSRGTFDYTLYDEALNLAARYGKIVGFGLCGGTQSPSWIYVPAAQGGPGCLPYIFTQGTGSATMPTPWDTAYQTVWKEAIVAIATRYDQANTPADHYLRYVWITGVGPEYETSFLNNSVDVMTFENNNGQALWEAAAKTIAGFYINTFWHTTCIFALNAVTPDAAGKSTIEDLNAYELNLHTPHYGFCGSGLYAGSSPSNSYTCAEMVQRYTQNMVGFQMNLPMHGASIAPSLSAGIACKAHYVEVYSSDCADPTQQTNLANANIGLSANAQGSP